MDFKNLKDLKELEDKIETWVGIVLPILLVILLGIAIITALLAGVKAVFID